MEKPSNSCRSLLNGIGKLSSGLLGAPYALAQKVKSAAVATLETMSNQKKLKEKEERIVSLKRNYELELLNEQEERTKLLGKAKEEQMTFNGQIAPKTEKPSTSCRSLLSGIGKLSSGLMGAHYALAQKVKSTAVATIETMSNKKKLKEKEEQIVSLKRNYELELLNEQEERTKLLGKEKEEQMTFNGQIAPKMEKPSNSCRSLLSGIGKLSSGLLGAPFALAQKVKSAAVATIETMSNKKELKEKEERILSSKRNYELEVLNEQEERTKLLGKAKEEQTTFNGQTAPEMEKPSSSYRSLLNGIGKLSSGLLGAPYALAQKVKSAAVATIEIMSNKKKLEEKEERIVSLTRNYELELLNEQEERTKLLGKAKEEHMTFNGQTAPEMEKPSNSCRSLLNGIGKLSSGLLGTPYALAQKVKSAAVATIETMSNKKKLKEKEERIVSLKRNYELELLNKQEERTKLLGKAKEEQKALIDQLNSVKGTITSLGQELKSEKSLIGELKIQIERLETELSKTDSDKKDLEVNLNEKVDSVEILQKRIDLLSADLKDKEHVVQRLETKLSKADSDKKDLEVNLKEKVDSVEILQKRIDLLSVYLKDKEHVVERLETELSKTDSDKKDLEVNLKEKVDSVEILQKRIDLLSADLKDKEHVVQRLETELSKTESDKKDLEVNLKEKVDSIEILQKIIDLLSADLKDKEHVVQSLNSSLAENELELRNLISTYEQSKDELSNAHLQIQGLKDEMLKSQNELEGKDSLVMELNSRVSSLTLENNNFRSKHDVMEKEYSDLKLTSEKKAASDAKALREKEDELHKLKDKFELALDEARTNQVIIADLTQEQEGLKESLENESKKVNHSKHELEVAQENLEKSRNGFAELEKRKNQANELRKELELQVSKLSSELTEVKESLQSKLDEAKLGAEKLASEHTTVKEHLKTAQAKLQSISDELTTSLENRDSLQRELTDIYKKAEATVEDLKEEKKSVASLNKNLQALEKQVLKDKEARRSLEMNLADATNSLNKMNRNSVILSSELERAKSLISSLKNEKEVLSKSLTEQRNATKEAKEKINNYLSSPKKDTSCIIV